MDKSKSQLVRRLFAAYVSGRRDEAESILGAGLTFTSPYDDPLDRAAYFERCWPNNELIRNIDVRTVVEQGDQAFALYECETNAGTKFVNTEHFIFSEDQIVAVQVFFGDPPSGTSKQQWREAASASSPEAAIAVLLEARAAAVRDGDAVRAMESVAVDVECFDVVEPLRRQGSESATARARTWFASFQGPIGFEMKELVVTATGATAVARSLNHYFGSLKSGGRLDMWVRSTLGLEKRGLRWWITHEHASVPFDPGTGKASLALQP